MLVSRPITSGTPWPAANAARYFLLISPNGCSTKFTLTPGWDCSNSGISVCIDTLSKYEIVSWVVGEPVSVPATGALVAVVAESAPLARGWVVGAAAGLGLTPHAMDTMARLTTTDMNAASGRRR